MHILLKSVALYCASLTVMPLSALAAPITYTITPVVLTPGQINTGPSTETLTGWITTDGTIGVLSSSNIIGWSWTTTGPYIFSESYSDSSSTAVLATGGAVGYLVATATTLGLPIAPDGGPNSSVQYEIGLHQSLINNSNYYLGPHGAQDKGICKNRPVSPTQVGQPVWG